VDPPVTADGAGLRAKEIDPLKLLNALFFSKFLKCQDDFSRAMGAANAYDHPDQDPEDRDDSKDPHGMSLHRAMSRLDLLDCLLHRREFHAYAMFDSIFAINLFTDSSPVAGHEMQGMLMDITFQDKSTLRIVLPGASLIYGQLDTINKTAGLLHAIWMIAGPSYDDVWYVCSKVVSCTTDMGVEIGTLTVPDFVRAYCSFMDGTPWEQLAGLINIDRRWLPGAFRLSGWSHCYGNIMKSIANKVVPWPTILDKMRALVNFFKVHDWRLHAKRMCHLEGITDFNLDVLDTFGASFAHWRYETVPLVQTQLLTIRILCQRHMKQEWFMNVQDRPCHEKALDACKDDFFWTFTAVSKRDILGT